MNVVLKLKNTDTLQQKPSTEVFVTVKVLHTDCGVRKGRLGERSAAAGMGNHPSEHRGKNRVKIYGGMLFSPEVVKEEVPDSGRSIR